MMAETGGSGAQEEVKKASNDSTRIIVEGIDGKKMGYTLERNTRTRQVKKAYCDKYAIPFNSIALQFNGYIIHEEQTVHDLDIKDGDHIDVILVPSGEMSLTTVESMSRAAMKKGIDEFVAKKAKVVAADKEATKTWLLTGSSYQDAPLLDAYGHESAFLDVLPRRPDADVSLHGVPSGKKACPDDDVDASKGVMLQVSDDQDWQMHHDTNAKGLNGVPSPANSSHKNKNSDNIIEVARQCAENVDVTMQYAKRIFENYEKERAIDKRVIAELEKKLKEANKEKMDAIAKTFEAKMEAEDANNKLKDLENKHNKLKTMLKEEVKS